MALALTAASGASVALAPVRHPSGATPGPTATSPVERTGTSVVLGPKHLASLGALLVVLIAGIAVLGYVALNRGDGRFADSRRSAGALLRGSTGAVDPQERSRINSRRPSPGRSRRNRRRPRPPNAAPARSGSATTSSKPAPSSSAAAQADAAARKAKAAAKTPESRSAAASRALVAPPPESAPPPPPPKPEVPPVTFKDVKVLVAQGDSMRERDAVLTLDRRSSFGERPFGEVGDPFGALFVDPAGVFFAVQAAKWKTPDGKEAVVSVDLGKMSFFRGERNWLILTTQGAPVFIRFEDGDLRTVLPAVQERSGVKVQR